MDDAGPIVIYLIVTILAVIDSDGPAEAIIKPLWPLAVFALMAWMFGIGAKWLLFAWSEFKEEAPE